MANSKTLDPRLAEWATPVEKKYLAEVIRAGSSRKAAAVLGTHRSCIDRAIIRLQKRATAAGFAPAHDLTHEVAPGMRLGFVTTQYDGRGDITQQWVRQNPQVEQALELLREAMEEITDAHSRRLAPLKAPKQTLAKQLAVYPLADPHIGMLSWAAETGENFNLQIAERMLEATVDRLVASAPAAKEALFVNLGDFLHVDNKRSQTTRGTNVDTDGRLFKIAKAGMRIKRRIIDRLLQKHRHVRVWTLAGNHDENTSIMLAVALEAIYEREPRITVSVDPAPFQVLPFGSSLIGAAHGHTTSIDKLPAFMAAQWPKKWGAAEHRIWYTGHVHHDSVKEHAGCLVETLRTTAAQDAWHVGKAYHSGRDLKCDVWHKSDGRIARLIQRVVAG